MRPTCPTKALWDGPHAGIDGAQRHFLPDGAAHDVMEAGAVLRSELLPDMRTLYHERSSSLKRRPPSLTTARHPPSRPR